jgi:hypothetical protein
MNLILILSFAAAILWLAAAFALSLRGNAGRSTPRSTALDRLRAMQFEGKSR